MYKLYCIIFLRLWVLFFSYGSYAISPDFNWTKGEVILTDSSRLSGELSVNYSLDLLLVKKDGNSMQVYPAHKVKSFALYDSQTQNRRQFISWTFQSVKGMKGQAFFEIVTFGTLSILRREKKYHLLGPHRSLSPEYRDHAFEQSNTDKYVYFVLNGSTVTDFITFQKELSKEVFAEYRQEIEAFMKKKSARRWKHGDFAHAIRYYNALKLRNRSENRKLAYAHPGI